MNTPFTDGTLKMVPDAENPYYDIIRSKSGNDDLFIYVRENKKNYIVLAAYINDTEIARTYLGYSLSEAMRRFKKYIKTEIMADDDGF